MANNPVVVRCYSGYICSERPEAFLWEGRKLTVKSVEREWREPGIRCFRIRTDDESLFELRYHEAADEWHASALL